jgi:hypothetical protein
MFIFIAHAEADQAAADDLKAFLKTRGLVVETETGARGFRHLQASDVVIALWSQKSVFGAHKMQMEKRMLDAWADQQLVLVKLDHGFLPVGMRDLPAIDAGFEQSRKLSVWPQVERAAKEAMNRALVERSAAAGKGAGGFSGGSDGPIPPPQAAAPAPGASRSRSAEKKSAPTPPAAAKRGSPLGAILLLLILAAVGAAGYLWMTTNSAAPPPPPGPDQPAPAEAGLSWPILAAVIIAGGVLLGLAFSLVRGASKSKKAVAAPKPAARVEESAPAPAPAAEIAAAPDPAPSAALFISYAHADNAQVEPVVALVTASGRKIWIDKTGIQTGDGWAGEIVRAIKNAHGVIVMCSKHAFESDHVKREVYLADRYKKPMAPVFLEAAQPPEDFEYFFASVQWLELWKLPEADRPAAIGKALEAV